APLPGADDAMLTEPSRALSRDAEPPRSGGEVAAGRPPLDGIKVLDLATWIAAPIGVKYLADLGADVIKIEPPGGQGLRDLASDTRLGSERGKRAVELDLKSPAGREIAHTLVANADVLVHNLRPGVPARLGLDFDTLKRINPRLIYCYASAYGSTGPY